MGKASRLFNGQAEHTLYERVTPTTEQREFLQQQWNELADYLKAELTGYGYPITTWLQGSYKYGTLIKPVHRDEEYDVDLGIYFDWDPKAVEIAPTAQQLRTWVQRELLAFKSGHPAVKDVADPPKERCSRAIYAKRFHIDTPTYHLDSKREKWAAAGSVDTDLSFLSFLKVYRTDVTHRRMTSRRVVEPFDVIKDVGPRLLPGPVHLPGSSLGLQ